MTDRLRSLDDPALEAALRDLAGALAMPAETGVTLELDPARRARVRIQQGEGAIAHLRRRAGERKHSSVVDFVGLDVQQPGARCRDGARAR